MHWARDNVNPMLALRNALCSGRWAEARSRILAQQHQQTLLTRQLRREHCLTEQATAPVTTETLPCTQPVELTAEPPAPQPDPLPDAHTTDPSSSTTPREPWRPGPNHPWRHSPIGKAKYRQRSHAPPARN